MRWHPFNTRIKPGELPLRFNNPFHYTPHPLCLAAADEVLAYIQTLDLEGKESGKMFGVLITQDKSGEIGFLAAFSGNLDGRNDEPYFVPPVCDLSKPSNGYKTEEAAISVINHQIEALNHDPEYLSLQAQLKSTRQEWAQRINHAKEEAKQAKRERDQRRLQTLTPEEEAQLIRESQFQKAELRRLTQMMNERLSVLQTGINQIQIKIDELKATRKRRSQLLQQQLFDQYLLENALGERKSVRIIFEEAGRGIPPAGTGECAAPKLLLYAYQQGLKPIAMAEFWWGESPKNELRRHGNFYPSCKEKCEPLLRFMLQGLDVEENPLEQEQFPDLELEVLWEDENLAVVHKPAGLLSVPGKEKLNSVYEWAHKHYPEADGPLLVHRLDMATSGLLLIAKNKRIHQQLQAQFERREVKKRYVALLERPTLPAKGTIQLPLCLDPNDRPRQIVHPTLGKEAVTRYEVVGQQDGHTRVHFYPETGRTHQLRVHAAHPEGLNNPIVGDTLYGRPDKRLYLHAERLEFTHPVTGKRIIVEAKADF